MKMFYASIVVGSFLLLGAPPAATGQALAAPGSGAPILLAAGDDATANRDSYTQQAQEDMQEWQQKLHDYAEQAEAKGQEVGSAAKSDLDAAWTKAEAASRKLQTVGAEGWQSAKTSYEKASQDLTAAWHKIQPNNK